MQASYSKGKQVLNNVSWQELEKADEVRESNIWRSRDEQKRL